MTKEITKLGLWKQVNNVLMLNLQSALQLSNSLDFSDEPQSEYQKVQEQIERIFDAMDEHVINGLQIIDDHIASGSLIADIRSAAAEAKKEADKLKKATKTLNKIKSAVDKITDVVTKIAGLPFL